MTWGIGIPCLCVRNDSLLSASVNKMSPNGNITAMQTPATKGLTPTQPAALTPLQADLAGLLAEILVLDVQAERLVPEPVLTVKTQLIEKAGLL